MVVLIKGISEIEPALLNVKDMDIAVRIAIGLIEKNGILKLSEIHGVSKKHGLQRIHKNDILSFLKRWEKYYYLDGEEVYALYQGENQILTSLYSRLLNDSVFTRWLYAAFVAADKRTYQLEDLYLIPMKFRNRWEVKNKLESGLKRLKEEGLLIRFSIDGHKFSFEREDISFLGAYPELEKVYLETGRVGDIVWVYEQIKEQIPDNRDLSRVIQDILSYKNFLLKQDCFRSDNRFLPRQLVKKIRG
jgi:hypothetical protein